MRFLIDTHAFLWAATSNPRLSPVARELIEDIENTPLVSMACLWEIAIKLNIGKLKLDLPFLDVATHKLSAHGMETLPITLDHLDIVSRLPTHHRDPFDRLLVAQCQAGGLAIVSNDSVLDDYGIERLW